MADREHRELRGRQRETEVLRGLVSEAKAGRSQVLLLTGEAGVGKSALLDTLVAGADGCRITRTAGVESEMELAYAGLHQLLQPFLEHLERLPAPQREALGTAFGLVSGPTPDKFLIGLAVLNLLCDAAGDRPVLCVVDDAQWLDLMSARILAFVARRLAAESVVMVFAVRDGIDHAFTGLTELAIRGLDETEARALLESVLPGPIDPRVRDRIVAETHGNPLALLELPRAWTAAELAGGRTAGSLAGRIEDSFVRRLEVLEPDTRLLLLTAAAEPLGDPTLLWQAAERLGLGADELAERHPSLVVAGISGYGTGGPLRDRKAYDMLIQAESGLISVTGTPETATKTGVPSADIAAGLYTSQAIVAALFRRERTGKGGIVDVSMFDATVEWLGHPMYMQMYGGRQVPRMGLSHASIAPYDAYPTADGEILIGVQNDRGWRALVTDVFERPDLADHPRLATNPLRVAHRDECDAVVAEHTRGFATADLDARLAAAGVPAAQINDMSGLVEHPQLAGRDRWREVATPAGPVRGVLPPMTFRDVELPMGAIPELGAHTDAVLAELGLDAGAIDRLAAGGVVGRPTDVPVPTP